MMLDERSLRYLIEIPSIKVGADEFQLRLVGFSETPNNDVLIAIAIGDIDERLQLQLSEGQRRDPIATRQRIVFFAKRIITTTHPHASVRLSA